MLASDERIINLELPGLKIRTSPHIIMYFRRNSLVCENYVTRQTFQANPQTCEFLYYFSKRRTSAQAFRKFRQYSKKSVLHSLRNLLNSGLLIADRSIQAELEQKFGKEWLWPRASRYYHFSTKLDEPFSTQEGIKEYYERHLRGKKQPSFYKSYPGRPKLKLPRVSGGGAPLFETLLRRHTTRNFSGDSITLGQLSKITFYTWGKVSTIKTPEFGRLLHKTSPSAGARHPIEAYLIINNVEGVKAGIYHYSVKDHSLELLRLGDFREDCARFSAGQSWTKNASVFFVMTSVVARTAWKYRIPRVYRAFLLDAGHLSQSFLLVSTALGLGAFCIGVISDITIESELGIDGINETVLFAVGVGRESRVVPGSSERKPGEVSMLN